MEQGRRAQWLVVLLAILAGLVVGVIGGALVGGVVGYLLGRDQTIPSSIEARLEGMEQTLREVESRLDEGIPSVLPWEDIPPEWLPQFPPEETPVLPPQRLPERYPQGTTGAFVSEVIPGTPAERAGVRAGDIILAVSGEDVSAARPLPELLAQYRPGDGVELLILRAGEEISLRVRLGESPEQPGQAYLGVWVRMIEGSPSLVP